MDIKWRHLRYALAPSAGVFVPMMALLLALYVFEDRSLEDIAWGAGVAFILCLIVFGYYLWRTQAKRPPPLPPDG